MNIPTNFKSCKICELEEDKTHDLVRYIRGLRRGMENMNHCKTSQEAYIEAICVEHTLKRSRMKQDKPKERKFPQRTRAHVVETHFAREDNPILLVIHRLLTTNEKEEKEW